MNAAITREEMPVWSRYIQEICGIHLDDSKGYLVETRLGCLLAEAGAANFSELFYKSLFTIFGRDLRSHQGRYIQLLH